MAVRVILSEFLEELRKNELPHLHLTNKLEASRLEMGDYSINSDKK